MLRVHHTKFLLLLLGTAFAGCERPSSAPDTEPPAPLETAPSETAPAIEPQGPTTAEGPVEPTRVHRIKAHGQLGPGPGTLLIDLQPPSGGELTEGAPVRITAKGRDLTFPQSIRSRLDPKTLPLQLPVVVTDGAIEPAEVDLSYYWCSAGDTGSCHPVRVRLLVELDLTGAAAGGEAHLTYRPES